MADIRPEVVEAMAATLDLDVAPTLAEPLPPGWHWLFFNPRPRARELDIDGHPMRGGFLPPIPLPRRMWAGGRLQFNAPLPIGSAAERESEIVKVAQKQGRQGDLVFVTVRHVVRVDGTLAIEEEQDIVYRDRSPPRSGDQDPAAGQPHAEWTEDHSTDPVLLFRYSALTFNGHRIHYDAPFATATEGYDGLLVHGPLLATLLMNAVVRHATPRRLREFDYRGLRPLVVGQPFKISGRAETDEMAVWTHVGTGEHTMSARAKLD